MHRNAATERIITMAAMTIDQLIEYWAHNAGTDADFTARKYHARQSIFPSRDGRTLYNYGYHFPLGTLIGKRGGKTGLFLLNGDVWTGSGGWGPSTSSLQADVRAAVKKTGVPWVVLPFSALEQAGIIKDSIKVTESLPETYTKTQHHAATLDDVPKYLRPAPAGSGFTDQNDRWSVYSEAGHYAATETDQGWDWETTRHWLGSAVFSARYAYTDRAHVDKDGRRDYPYITRSAHFLSAFDENEPAPLYFLAQLPRGCRPGSYAEAIEMLKPTQVRDAEAAGIAVVRQGDVFAVATPLTTREVHTLSNSSMQRAGTYVLGVNHTVTDVTEVYPHGKEIKGAPRATYARGTMRHKPREWGRAPEHRRVKLGDGKTWHRLYLNTVPVGRSWSRAGNVD